MLLAMLTMQLMAPNDRSKLKLFFPKATRAFTVSARFSMHSALCLTTMPSRMVYAKELKGSGYPAPMQMMLNTEPQPDMMWWPRAWIRWEMMFRISSFLSAVDSRDPMATSKGRMNSRWKWNPLISTLSRKRMASCLRASRAWSETPVLGCIAAMVKCSESTLQILLHTRRTRSMLVSATSSSRLREKTRGSSSGSSSSLETWHSSRTKCSIAAEFSRDERWNSRSIEEASISLAICSELLCSVMSSSAPTDRTTLAPVPTRRLARLSGAPLRPET
mmetsp:Transcript_68342/g.182067  ORF Transcript_68342/g.182067 Transcript_68342/m.182067 type:complete len:276 (+) Transcript_68342:1425-2252(+)